MTAEYRSVQTRMWREDEANRLQYGAICGMLFSSEQVLETHGIATTTGVFCCPKKHTCSAQSAPSIDHAATANACVATWVSSLDRRRALRVQQQEAV